MDAMELLLSRESALKLEPPGPDRAALDAIFQSAVRAPDHGRMRPWRFVVIPEDKRAAFGDLMADCMRRREPAASAEMLLRERDKAMRAPIIVVAAAHVEKGHKIRGSGANGGRRGGGAKHHAGGERAGLWRDVEDRRAGL